MYVIETAKDVYFRLGDDDSCAGCVLDSELCLALLSTNTADASAQVVSVKGLDVFDLERLKVQVVQSEDSDSVLQVETKHEALEEVSALLDGSDVLGVLGCLQLYCSPLRVHSHLELHVLDKSLQNAVPFLLQWCEPVPGNWNSSVLILLSQVTNLHLVEFNLFTFLLDCFHLSQFFAVFVSDVCIHFHAIKDLLDLLSLSLCFLLAFNLSSNATNC